MRYFFINYKYITLNGNGNGSIYLKRETFPPKSKIVDYAENAVVKEFKIEKNNIQIIILNWIEMTEEDYNSFLEL